MNELIDKVLQWGVSRGITGPTGRGTPTAQADKMMEEAHETYAAVKCHRYICKCDTTEAERKNALPEIKDGIGDTAVTLILLAEMYGWTLEDCLQHAYDVISKRKGVMHNGTFIKNS